MTKRKIRSSRRTFSNLRSVTLWVILLFLGVICRTIVDADPSTVMNRSSWWRKWLSPKSGLRGGSDRGEDGSSQSWSRRRSVWNNDSDIVVPLLENEEEESSHTLVGQLGMTPQKLRFLDRISWISAAVTTLRSQSRDPVDNITNATANTTSGTGILDLDAVTPQSDLTLPGRHFHIVTTATLPWFTGTAVNPLLRAAHLVRRTAEINRWGPQPTVTLVIPWLELNRDQEALYGQIFEEPEDQEAYIRAWLRDQAGMPDVAKQLLIRFYPARYHSGLRSIFAMGDLIGQLQSYNDTLDVCILEEPEHCNWYRAPGNGWTEAFDFVVGIVHTNYKEYAGAHYSGLFTAPAIQFMSAAMVRAYCHKVIKLSDVFQAFAPEKEVTSNVHGVRSDFLDIGRKRKSSPPASNQTDIYFIGKMLWAKGLDILLDLQDYYKQCTGEYFPIDIYGSGPDQDAIMRAFHGRKRSKRRRGDSAETQSVPDESMTSSSDDENDVDAYDEDDETAKDEVFMSEGPEFVPSLEMLQAKARAHLARIKASIYTVEIPKTFSELRRQPIPAKFPGRVDHGTLSSHKIFVNPSISEVLCTTTAEALAMGKFAIIPVHPSNTFFLQFPNCLPYRNKFEFVANLRWAQTHEPEPLSPEDAYMFSWEAATERLIEASAITWREAFDRERLGLAKLDERIAWFHKEIGKGATGDMLRRIFGAGPASDQVKYQRQQGQETPDDDDDDDDEDDDGLMKKLRGSSFAEAIRATVGDMASFMQ